MPTPLSSSTIKKFQKIYSTSKEMNISKMCEHVLEQRNDVEEAVNVLLKDSNFYRPFKSAELGEMLVAISSDAIKIQMKMTKKQIIKFAKFET